MNNMLAKLKAGIKNRKTIKFPGTDQDVVLRVLSEAELQDAALAADQHFKAKKVDIGFSTADELEAEQTLQVIYRSIKDASGNPIVDSVDEFRNLITSEEKSILTENYQSLEQECSPREMSAKKFDDLLENVKKNPEMTVGSVSNITTARRLIICLVSQLQS